MGMITCPPLVVRLLVRREGDETLNYGGAHRRVGGGVEDLALAAGFRLRRQKSS